MAAGLEAVLPFMGLAGHLGLGTELQGRQILSHEKLPTNVVKTL